MPDSKQLTVDQKRDAVKSLMEPGDSPAIVQEKLLGKGYENFSRQAVIGLLHRNNYFGLNGQKEKRRSRTLPMNHPGRMAKARNGAPITGRKPGARAPSSISLPQRKHAEEPKLTPFVRVGPFQCRWPMWGDGPIEDVDKLMVCGDRTEGITDPYCAFHRQASKPVVQV